MAVSLALLEITSEKTAVFSLLAIIQSPGFDVRLFIKEIRA